MESEDSKLMPPPSAPPAVEYKKDGTISRMRAHKGNVPQLPQTKLCPYCPAKFTRTTHLNRHLRNHTNERLYRCETCGAQFTRSDLLARHKKSCGESHPISRSRRRSCQACAALKVKCDLRHPCSKCLARSRDCVYASESPEERRSASPARRDLDASMSADSKPVLPQGVTNVDASAGFDPWAFANSGSFLDPAFPELSLIEEANILMSQPLTEANMAASFGTLPRSSSPVSQARSLPNFDAVTSNTASSYTQRDRLPSFFQSELAGGATAANLSSFSNDMFEPFFRDIFATSTQNSQDSTPPSGQDGTAVPASAGPSLTDFLEPSPFLFTGGSSNGISGEIQPSMESDLMYDMMSNTYPQDVPPTYTPAPDPHRTYYVDPLLPHSQLQLLPMPAPAEPDTPEPTTEELQKYLYIFLTSFLPQMPVVHTPSLRVELKPPILLRAMQACGALFVKTRTAEAFVERTLNTSREVLVSEFAKPSPDPKHQVHIIITVILLQTIGLFHQDPLQRARSNIYHGMLVLMIRQTHVIERNASWQHQTFTTDDPAVLESTWRDWAGHETIKRALLLAYCHDRSHPVYFAMRPSFHSTEYTIQLPCDEALWNAPTPRAWARLAMTPSPYGIGTPRITGVPMPLALHAVGYVGLKIDTSGSPAPPADIPVIPPFGHFIIMHALLGELFRRCSVPPTPAELTEGEVVNEHVFAMQFALHRWLQLWLHNPECPRPPPPPRPSAIGPAPPEDKHDPPFMQDPLPFYWLAQLLLLAFQENFPPFGPPTGSPSSSTSASASASGHGRAYDSPHSSGASASPSALNSPSMFASADVVAPKYHGVQPPSQPDTSIAQFTLVKNWQQHIRLFLRRNQGSPTVIWDELMKIRLKGWSTDFSMPDPLKAATEGGAGGAGDAVEAGLLGFFEEKLKI